MNELEQHIDDDREAVRAVFRRDTIDAADDATPEQQLVQQLFHSNTPKENA